jgi:hypothetical protein
MSGTDKRKLLVTGENAKSWCFEEISIGSLPVLYYATKNSCMIYEICKKWIMSWDVELQLKSREILLVPDNCAAPPHLESLKKKIQLEFMSSNITWLVQPINIGIKEIEDLISRRVGKLHLRSNSIKFTDIIFNS